MRFIGGPELILQHVIVSVWTRKYVSHALAVKLSELTQISTACSKGKKGKEEYLYSAFSHQGTYKALRHGSVSYTHLTLPTNREV